MLMHRKPGFLKAILLTTLLAGTLDITAACTQFYLSGGKDLTKLFRFIASGFFGKAAPAGDAAIAWGLFFHYLVAFIFTAVFFLLYPYIHKVIKSAIVAGLLYGVVVWIIMNLIVLPLSNTPPISFNLTKAAIGMGILMVMIGVPVSIMSHRYYKLYKG